jgi:hypothetical protein
VATRCRARGGDRLDLTQPTTARELEPRWPEVRLWREGRSIGSWRSLFAARTAFRIAAAQVTVLTLVGASMQLLAEGTAGAAALVPWLIVAVLAVPLYTAFLHAVAVLLVHRGVASLGRLSAVLPRVRLDVLSVPHETRGTATLVTALVVRRVRDDASWMPLDDAWLDAAELELDGETLRLDLAAGSLDLAGASSETETERDAGYREPTAAPPPPGPARRAATRASSASCSPSAPASSCAAARSRTARSAATASTRSTSSASLAEERTASGQCGMARAGRRFTRSRKSSSTSSTSKIDTVPSSAGR